MGLPRSPVGTFSIFGRLGLPVRRNLGQVLGWALRGRHKSVRHGLLRILGGAADFCLYFAECRVVEEGLMYRSCTGRSTVHSIGGGVVW